MEAIASSEAAALLSRLAGQWQPVLPTIKNSVNEEDYYRRFDVLIDELRSNAERGHARSVSALAGQVLEFALKVALESDGIGRSSLSRRSGTLHKLIVKAQDAKILFDPKSVLDSMGNLELAVLDSIQHRDLVQHSILQAREYRNRASHADPWTEPVDILQATRQLGAVIALIEYLAPSLPSTESSSESQIELLQTLRDQGVDLAVGFLPERSVKRVNEIVATLRTRAGDTGAEALLEAVVRNPMWLFARSSRTKLPEVRRLIQTMHAVGYITFAYAAAVLLPINDLALVHIIRRSGQGFCDHIMMAKKADQNLFTSLLSSESAYPAFIDEFINQVKGTGGRGGGTLRKADYLARAFSGLPSRLRNQILIRLGPDASIDWFNAIQFGHESAVLRGISDEAVTRLPALESIRARLRCALLERISGAPPRHIIHSYLNFAHIQPREYRKECYGAILAAVLQQIDVEGQEAAGCRAVIEIALSVGCRGPVWVKCQSLAAKGCKVCGSDAVRFAYWLITQGLNALGTIDVNRADAAVRSLSELVQQDALTAYLVTSFILPLAPVLQAEIRDQILLTDALCSTVVERNRTTPPNIIDSLSQSMRNLRSE